MKKGQALVEFVLIMPIFLIIICGSLEIANITYIKYKMEEDLNTVSRLYEKKEKEKIDRYISINKIDLKLIEKNEFLTIKIYKKIKIITPILSNVLGNEYEISASRMIYNE